MNDWDTPTPDGWGWAVGCFAQFVVLCLIWAAIGAIVKF